MTPPDIQGIPPVDVATCGDLQQHRLPGGFDHDILQLSQIVLGLPCGPAGIADGRLTQPFLAVYTRGPIAA